MFASAFPYFEADAELGVLFGSQTVSLALFSLLLALWPKSPKVSIFGHFPCNGWITFVEQVQLEALRSSNDIDSTTSMLTRFRSQNVLMCF